MAAPEPNDSKIPKFQESIISKGLADGLDLKFGGKWHGNAAEQPYGAGHTLGHVLTG